MADLRSECVYLCLCLLLAYFQLLHFKLELFDVDHGELANAIGIERKPLYLLAIASLVLDEDLLHVLQDVGRFTHVLPAGQLEEVQIVVDLSQMLHDLELPLLILILHLVEAPQPFFDHALELVKLCGLALSELFDQCDHVIFEISCKACRGGRR